MKTKPSKLQRKAVNNVLSGKFKSIAEAMRDAGYSGTTSHRPKEKLADAKGVQAYLEQLGGKAIQKFGMSLEDKVMDVYMEGLDATRLYGKDAIPHPDWQSRLQFADRFAKFFGWVQDNQTISANRIQQFNYFGIAENQKAVFNKKFSKFLDTYYNR